MKKIVSGIAFLTLISILFFPYTSVAQPAQWVLDKYEPYNYVYNYNSVATELAYRLMRPINFNASKKYPVIITLHGGTAFRLPQSPRYNIYNLQEVNEQIAYDSIRSEYPAYVLVPQGKSDNFWQPDDLVGIKGIIATLPSVDLNRIYIMGTSAGGNGTHDFISSDPSYFAAAISSAANPDKISVGKRANLVNFNLWHMVGETDLDQNRYPGSVAFFDDMKSRNAKMKFTIFWKLGHSIGDLMIADDKIFGALRNGYKTENAGTNSDSEPNTLKWLFSKSKVGTVLPLTFAEPTKAYRVTNGITVEWAITSEINCDRFEIERSTNTVDFKKIATVKGQTASNTYRLYTILDAQPNIGSNYYRIKQIDLNGNFTYSRIINATYDNVELKLSPNPVSDLLHIISNKPIEKIEILNTAGQVVKTYLGSNLNLDVLSLSKGTYILKTYNKEKQFIIKRFSKL